MTTAVDEIETPDPKSQLAKDRTLAKTYRSFILQFNGMYDQSWYSVRGERLRNYNCKLEHLRNTKGGPACFPPSLKKITAHLNRFTGGKKEDTIFFINEGKFSEFLCLVDIDSYDPYAAQFLAEYILKKYLSGDAYIDRSPGGTGRHVYFKLNVIEDALNLFPGQEIKRLLHRFKTVMQNDPFVKLFSGATLCSLLGEPTIWRKTNDQWRIEHRGSVVKAPYFHGDVLAGIESVSKMRSIPLLALKNWLGKLDGRAIAAEIAPGSSVSLKNGSAEEEKEEQEALTEVSTALSCTSVGVLPASLPLTSPSPSLSPFQKIYMGVTITGQNGLERKRECVTQLLRRLNRPISVEEALEEYVKNYAPTGFSPQDVARREAQVTEMVKFYNGSFKPRKKGHPHAFKKGRYLEICKTLVPQEAFIWNRREKLTHEKLADFISVKIQDAFFNKEQLIARASRDGTIENMRVMKAKGLVDWIVDNHTYKKLLDIAVEYSLLQVYEPHIPPTRGKGGVKIAKGIARMIGPGKALAEEFGAFQVIYEAYKKQMTMPEWLVA